MLGKEWRIDEIWRIRQYGEGPLSRSDLTLVSNQKMLKNMYSTTRQVVYIYFNYGPDKSDSLLEEITPIAHLFIALYTTINNLKSLNKQWSDVILEVTTVDEVVVFLVHELHYSRKISPQSTSSDSHYPALTTRHWNISITPPLPVVSFDVLFRSGQYVVSCSCPLLKQHEASSAFAMNTCIIVSSAPIINRCISIQLCIWGSYKA